LARNPFPIIIPCHRAIRTDGRLGGYQGVLVMGQQLPEMEGINMEDSGYVTTRHYFYGRTEAFNWMLVSPESHCLLIRCKSGQDNYQEVT
jgi:6-O-methylguanine DNA methyltransferase, DNA binding domain